MKTTITSIAAALTLSVFGCMPAAQANGVQCPGNPTEWRDDVKWCPGQPSTPTPAPGNTSSNSSSEATANAGAIANGGFASSTGGDATSTATGGTSFGSRQGQSQSSSARTGNVTVNSNSRAAASSAIAPQLGGYGLPNCFGDTNPSGSFVAAFGNVFASASAGGMKASNICAAYAIGGEELALRYLMRMDRNMPRSITIEVPTRVTCPASHPVYVEGRGCRR